MSYRMYGAFIASLSVAALMLATTETFARSGGASARAGVVSRPSVSRPFVGGQAFRHHGRGFVGSYWPGAGGFYPGASGSEPVADGTQQVSGDIRYTYTYDVPWDWAHRYPPAVVPSDRPYVSSCGAETVTVPGRGGGEHTVNITRCY